jgi:diphthine-ammonia ligase
MCGIVGVFNNEKATRHVRHGLVVLRHRGQDSCGVTDGKTTIFAKRPDLLSGLKSSSVLGHCLHSVAGLVRQPIDNSFAANCEIYNWSELAKRYRLSANNDAEVLCQIVKRDKLEECDGVYAYVHWQKDKVTLARDPLGIKPLWYSHQDGFAVASEKKALERLGYLDVIELNPRTLLVYDIGKDSIEVSHRRFFTAKPESRPDLDRLEKLISQAVTKRVPERRFGLLFSGGIDSTVLAFMLKRLGHDFTCYTSAFVHEGQKEPEDLVYARRVAKELGLSHKVLTVTIDKVPSLLKTIVLLIEDSNVTKVSVALPFYVACQQARKDGCRVIFSGLGSEEIFAGYKRHRDSLDINQECLSGLLRLYERDTYRDDVITMFHSLELRLPFLDRDLVSYALRLPSRHKIRSGKEKIILRLLAERLGIPKEFSWRKKRAAQYGSSFMKAIDMLTRKNSFSYKSDYLRTFYRAHNLRLGVLFSSGKDSAYASYVMHRQNYRLACLITLRSSNPDSYMFHTPNVHLAGLQAEAMGLPLIEQETWGQKEQELSDLESALRRAKKQCNIQGVVTGALYSNYQRKRIERVCDRLGLKVFSPLWHINQETLMRELIEKGFEFVFSSVAAEGLDRSWLCRPITHKDVDALRTLHDRIGINIAGEGGEFETLVLDCPLFKKRISIVKGDIVEQAANTAQFLVEKACLSRKL